MDEGKTNKQKKPNKQKKKPNKQTKQNIIFKNKQKLVNSMEHTVQVLFKAKSCAGSV
jgi:hypothetical protein